MEYDYKTGNLIFDFNDSSYPTKNDFKLIVTDNVGNSTKFESLQKKITFETNSNIYNKSNCSLSLAQTATIQGVILSEFNEPVSNANITSKVQEHHQIQMAITI